jgi:hypothetical protein
MGKESSKPHGFSWKKREQGQSPQVYQTNREGIEREWRSGGELRKGRRWVCSFRHLTAQAGWAQRADERCCGRL